MNLSFLKIMCIIILIFSSILPVNAALLGDMRILWNNVETSNIDLGDLSANNTTTTWPASISYPPQGFVIQRLDNNQAADLYIRVNDSFTDGLGNTISYDNFEYSGYGINFPITSFTTTSTLVRANWRRNGGNNQYLPVTLYLTVPYGTEPGTYTITVIHTLLSPGSISPLSQLSEVINYNDSSNQTDNITEGTNNTTQNLNISI